MDGDVLGWMMMNEDRWGWMGMDDDGCGWMMMDRLRLGLGVGLETRPKLGVYSGWDMAGGIMGGASSSLGVYSGWDLGVGTRAEGWKEGNGRRVEGRGRGGEVRRTRTRGRKG